MPSQRVDGMKNSLGTLHEEVHREIHHVLLVGAVGADGARAAASVPEGKGQKP